MRDRLFRKPLVLAVIVLFIGAGVAPSINADVGKASVNRSSYTPHDPIYINGNDDFTVENGVTGGSGTSNDPYVIEDWEIEASSMDAITIRNISVYFTIMNCCVHDGGINNDGIVFINVTNGVIEDTIITGNRNGVMFRTQFTGKENSENNIIRYNDITSNTKDGINFEHTGYGYHRNNIVFNNNISGNNKGISMIMSADNQIVYNNIFSNDEVGIRLDMCEGGGEKNIIHHNNFINNGEDDEQAFEYGDPQNRWDDDYPSGGNYWSDYNGIDDNGDGIGDTPYPIPFGDNEDRYPLMEPYVYINVPPSAPTIDGPKNGRVGIEYEYTFNSTDNDGDDVIYFVDWDDGLPIEIVVPSVPSGTEAKASHKWNKQGTYGITARTKDACGAVSPWSEPYPVAMPRNKAITSPFLNFLQQNLNLFQILQRLLSL